MVFLAACESIDAVTQRQQTLVDIGTFLQHAAFVLRCAGALAAGQVDERKLAAADDFARVGGARPPLDVHSEDSVAAAAGSVGICGALRTVCIASRQKFEHILRTGGRYLRQVAHHNPFHAVVPQLQRRSAALGHQQIPDRLVVNFKITHLDCVDARAGQVGGLLEHGAHGPDHQPLLPAVAHHGVRLTCMG